MSAAAKVQYIQTSSIETSIVLVTPEMAAEWLKKNTRNRNVSDRMVDSLSREIAEGRWQVTHQGIGFYADGTLADGQHRLEAVVRAGIPVYMTVTHGLIHEAVAAIDQHRMRRTTDVIRLSGKADWIGKDEVAILRIFISLLGGFGGIGRNNPIMSPMKVVEKASLVKDQLIFARHIGTGRTVKGVTNAPMCAAFALALGHENEARLIEFADVIKSGMASGEDDAAAIRLREWAMVDNTILGGESQRRAFVRRAQRAIKAFCKREPIKKLIEPQSLIYPVPEILKDN